MTETVEVTGAKKEKKVRAKRAARAKVLGMVQLLAMKHKMMEGLDEECIKYFGRLPLVFSMLVYGYPKNGKTNLVMQFLKWLMPFGKVLYVSLEEGFGLTTQLAVMRHLNKEAHAGKIEWADNKMTFDELRLKLSKKKSPRFIVIDSLQYWRISKDQFDQLRKEFPNKSFIWISHAQGTRPKGSLGLAVTHDVDVVVHVKDFLGFIDGRYGVGVIEIWPERAKEKWGRRYRKALKGYC